MWSRTQAWRDDAPEILVKGDGERKLCLGPGALASRTTYLLRTFSRLPFTPSPTVTPIGARPRRGVFVEPLQDILAREAVAALGRGVQQRDGARRVPLAPAAVEQAVGEHEEGRGVVLLRVRVKVGGWGQG